MTGHDYAMSVIEANNYTCSRCGLQYDWSDRMLATQLSGVAGGKRYLEVWCYLCIDNLGKAKGNPHGWRFMSRDAQPYTGECGC
jgi:hypothetical protein